MLRLARMCRMGAGQCNAKPGRSSDACDVCERRDVEISHIVLRFGETKWRVAVCEADRAQISEQIRRWSAGARRMS